VANAMTLVLAAVVLPAGTALVAQALMPAWRWSAAIGAVTGTLFAALPVLMASYGTLWPNVWATSSLPALLGATVLCLRRSGLTAWTALALAGAGAMLLHPSVLFGYGLLALPLLLQALVTRARRLHAGGRIRRAAAEWGVLGVVVVVGTLLVSRSQTVAAVRAYPRAPVESMAQAVGEALLDAPLSPLGYGIRDASWLVGALLVLGVVHAATVREQRPWVWSLALAVGAFAISAGAPPDSFLRMYVTGFWYNDPARLAGQVPVIAAPLAAVGVGVVARWLALLADGSRHFSGSGRAARVVRVAGVPVLLVAALVLTGGGYAAKRESRIAFDYWPDPADQTRQLVTPAEESLLRDLPHLVPKDAVIIADPYSGGALAYALGDRRVTFAHMIGAYPPEAVEARGLWPDLEDPAICRLLKGLQVRYFYADDYQYFQGGTGQVRFRNLDLVPLTGVRPVRRAGTATLYEITGCS
jgi:hypothetical protein